MSWFVYVSPHRLKGLLGGGSSGNIQKKVHRPRVAIYNK